MSMSCHVTLLSPLLSPAMTYAPVAVHSTYPSPATSARVDEAPASQAAAVPALVKVLPDVDALTTLRHTTFSVAAGRPTVTVTVALAVAPASSRTVSVAM